MMMSFHTRCRHGGGDTENAAIMRGVPGGSPDNLASQRGSTQLVKLVHVVVKNSDELHALQLRVGDMARPG